MSARLPRLRPPNLNDQQQALHDAVAAGPRAVDAGLVPLVEDDGGLAGPFNALLHSPVLGAAVQQVGACLRYASSLSPRERELATLFVAGYLHSRYELFAHTRLAVVAELTDVEVDACAAGREPPVDSAREQALLALTQGLCAATVSDPLVTAARHHLGTAGVVELTVLVGYYRLLAGVLDVAGVDAPE